MQNSKRCEVYLRNDGTYVALPLMPNQIILIGKERQEELLDLNKSEIDL